MKFLSMAFMVAASAAVVVSGEEPECEKKCHSKCTIKGDPHLTEFDGSKSFMHAKGKHGNKWINVYNKKGMGKVQVKVKKNGENEYVTDVKIGKKTFNVQKNCGGGRKLFSHQNVKIKCARIKRGQFDKVDDRKQRHFDLEISSKHHDGGRRVLARESGACVGGKHKHICGCSPSLAPHPKPHNHPHASPSPKPSGGPSPSPKPSCKETLVEECGTPPAQCWKDSKDDGCKSFIQCVDSKKLGKCYKPKTCKQMLGDTCGKAPKDCFEGIAGNPACSNFTACVEDHGFGGCYTPKEPTPEPFFPPSNKTLTCIATCSAKGDPHFTTFLGEKYKTKASGNKTITMINVDGFTVDAYVESDSDKEFITRVTFGSQVLGTKSISAEECNNETTVQKIKSANVEGTVKCAKPSKGFEKYGYHLDVELRQTFTMDANLMESATLETFVQAMGGAADTECLAGNDAPAAKMSGERLAAKLHCH